MHEKIRKVQVSSGPDVLGYVLQRFTHNTGRVTCRFIGLYNWHSVS